MSDLEYDRAQTQESQRVVSQEATAETSQAAGGLNTMATSQSETRWGVEEGAVAYKAQYEKNLQAVHDEVTALNQRLGAFVEALKASADSLEADEDDIVSAQLALQKKLDASTPAVPPADESS